MDRGQTSRDDPGVDAIGSIGREVSGLTLCARCKMQYPREGKMLPPNLRFLVTPSSR